ncbi:endonuclease/exonuclease/phosphatase family protein [Hwangdonia seohaensis]|uniref:Endonuclease/exonuclease/phosphatase family protein n=1 Tax=Hwangdonia seohaensis TaxID=1240727 RepID=A0ABW3R884_9FLAO|nr:endonuclease/exonuclease/phosphatase family protein [Hwangdonia seohaensis]
MLKIIRVLYLFLNIVIIGALLAIHFVFKEHSYQSSLLYYTFPLPVIILAVLLLSIFLNRKFKKLNLILAGLLLLIWLGRSFKISFPETINETDLEVVFWNAARENNFQAALNKNGDIPDVLVLVETGEYSIEEFQQKYPNYYFFTSDREMFIFSKTPLEIKSENTSKFKTTVIEFKTAGINFYAVDVTGSPDVPREWELRHVNEFVKRTHNTIVLGDFNAPYESKYLKQIKKNFNQAFNEKGNGFRETWFWNIPLLSLDHIWVSKDLKVLKTKKFYSKVSDHCMLKTYVRK